MAKLTQKQELDLYLAKLRIENKGIESFKTALYETDCIEIETEKKFLMFKFKSKEYKFTEDFAKQVLNIEYLREIKKTLEINKERIIKDGKEKEFNLLYKNVYYALSVYELKLDEIEREKDISRLIKICRSKMEVSYDYYQSNIVTLNTLFEQEELYLKALLKYNNQKIADYQKQQHTTKELENKSEEMDK